LRASGELATASGGQTSRPAAKAAAPLSAPKASSGVSAPSAARTAGASLSERARMRRKAVVHSAIGKCTSMT
jgi:hypothetical protein